jgi:pilus assembly protein CpaB
MRRGRILLFVVLILVVGLVVVAVAIRQFLLPSTSQQQQPAFVEVFATSQKIAQGEKIEASMLTRISLPADKVVDVMFTAAEESQLVGKVARFPLDPGVIITSAMVTEPSNAVAIAGPEWAALIPPGMTAMSIPASRLALAGYGITDGAHVNVNVCFLFVDVDPSFQTALPNSTAVLTGTGFVADQLPVLSLGTNATAGSNPQGRLELEPTVQQPFYVIPSEQQRPRQVCQMMFQDVVVMKSGNFAQAPAAAAQPPATQEQQAPATAPDIVTLIVSPQDSLSLSYLLFTNAKIILTLRNSSDQSRMATEAATLQFLLSQYNIPVPAKLPYAMQPRVDTLNMPVLLNDVPQGQ